MPDPDFEVLSVRFERALLARARELARATDRSAGGVIRLALRAFLKANSRRKNNSGRLG